MVYQAAHRGHFERKIRRRPPYVFTSDRWSLEDENIIWTQIVRLLEGYTGIAFDVGCVADLHLHPSPQNPSQPETPSIGTCWFTCYLASILALKYRARKVRERVLGRNQSPRYHEIHPGHVLKAHELGKFSCLSIGRNTSCSHGRQVQ